MKIDSDVQLHVMRAFASLNSAAAVHSFPPPAALSQSLNKEVTSAKTGRIPTHKTPAIARMFTTASVDMWLRAVHSFLISGALTDVSPIWASVAGYYSSHYSVRAIAHLLGFFQLFLKKRIVQLEVQGAHFVCTFNAKMADEREHRFYWKVLKLNPLFAADPFFTLNEHGNPDDPSDSAHRDWANYIDHLPQFPIFHPLDANALKSRIEKIAGIQFSVPPIPRRSKYPDLEAVQIIAYHRLIKFRDLVDTILGNGNRFWNVYRDPTWARGFMDFQLTEGTKALSVFTLQ
ncbi:MAG TPA: hypothetical protein VGK24_09920 [Candidatus Angelobacter sp.]